MSALTQKLVTRERAELEPFCLGQRAVPAQSRVLRTRKQHMRPSPPPPLSQGTGLRQALPKQGHRGYGDSDFGPCPESLTGHCRESSLPGSCRNASVQPTWKRLVGPGSWWQRTARFSLPRPLGRGRAASSLPPWLCPVSRDTTQLEYQTEAPFPFGELLCVSPPGQGLR